MNSTINVIVSISFIYLLYSLLASTIQEALEGIVKRRASTLYKAICSMTTDAHPVGLKQNTNKEWGARTLGNWLKLNWYFLFRSKTDASLCKLIYQHPVIKNYTEHGARSKPSYLTAQNFSSIFIETIKNLDSTNKYETVSLAMLRNTILAHSDLEQETSHQLGGTTQKSSVISSETFDILWQHLLASGDDLNIFRYRLEVWFNDTMDRVSGWYKRATQIWLFCIGFFLAVSLNIDTIKIVNLLFTNKDLAEKIANWGTSATQNGSQHHGVMLDSLVKEISAKKDSLHLTLGLGWKTSNKETGWDSSFKAFFRQVSVRSIIGFFLTAMAISLGAPFWFDLLNRFVNLRMAGKAINSSGPVSDQKANGKEIDG